MCGYWERNDDEFRTAQPILRTTSLGCSDNPHTPLIPAQAGIQGYTKALTLFSGSRFRGDYSERNDDGFRTAQPSVRILRILKPEKMRGAHRR